MYLKLFLSLLFLFNLIHISNNDNCFLFETILYNQFTPTFKKGLHGVKHFRLNWMDYFYIESMKAVLHDTVVTWQ